MIKKRLMIVSGILLVSIILSACSDRGIQEDAEITIDSLPEEPDKNELTSAIQSDNHREIDDLIEEHFPLMTIVNGDTYEAEVYATQRFNRSELVDLFAEAMEPEQISEDKDQQQIMIYPEDFVTVKQSEADSQVVLIEVASKEFVRNNYSPSFLSTYFTYRLLDSFLGNGWSDRRARDCESGGCYGGYSGKAYGTPKRGDSTFRGGGPGSGK